MRILVGVCFAAALAWFGYWFIGSAAHETAAKSWLGDRENAGWVVAYDSLDVQGFPNRFDTRITQFNIADPKAGWAWDAPDFAINSLSYKPNHFIAVWPEFQTISTLRNTYKVKSTKMRSSLVFEPNTSLALDRATMALTDVEITDKNGEISKIGSALLATHQDPDQAFGHLIAFNAKDVELAQGLKKWLDPESSLPTAFETFNLETTAVFDAAWDRVAIETRKPNLTRLDVDVFAAKWGVMELQGKGSITIDAAGYPDGKLSIRAKNWRDMIALAVQSGALDASVARSVETGLSLLAMLSGNKETLDIPLNFSNRVILLGPVPIGAAPRLRRN